MELEKCDVRFEYNQPLLSPFCLPSLRAYITVRNGEKGCIFLKEIILGEGIGIYKNGVSVDFLTIQEIDKFIEQRCLERRKIQS